MAAGGSTEESPDKHKWPRCKSFIVLGHTLAEDGSIRPCWQHTRQSMWKSFWANAGSRCGHELAVPLRVGLLAKTVGPVFDYRNSRWPPQKTVGIEIDRVQCKMVASILRIQRHLGEESLNYCRRRNRAAAQLCRQMGLWSVRWFNRALAWHKHILQPRNSKSWSSQLVMYRGKQWLQARRASFVAASSSSGSCLASKTATRSFQGCPNTRWHDGADYAQHVVGLP